MTGETKAAEAGKAPAYSVTLHMDEDGDWVARIPELPGCASHGRTEVEAVNNVREAQSLWLADAVAAGDQIPAVQKYTNRESTAGKAPACECPTQKALEALLAEVDPGEEFEDHPIAAARDARSAPCPCAGLREGIDEMLRIAGYNAATITAPFEVLLRIVRERESLRAEMRRREQEVTESLSTAGNAIEELRELVGSLRAELATAREAAADPSLVGISVPKELYDGLWRRCQAAEQRVERLEAALKGEGK